MDYPVEMTLNGGREIRGGYLPAEIVPWVGSASPEVEGQRLFEPRFTEEGLRRDWEQIRGDTQQRRIWLSLDATVPELHSIPGERLQDTNVEGVSQPLAASSAMPFSCS